MNQIFALGLMHGLLRNANGYVTGEIIIPTLGMDALGGLFTTASVFNSAGAPMTVGGSITIATTNLAVGLSSAQAIGANVNRRSLEFFNNSSTDTIFLGFGVAATVLLWPVLPNAYYTPPGIFQGVVNAIGAAVGPSILVINEGV